MEDRVCYSSFNHYTVTRIHALKPDAEVGFLYADGPIDMPSYGVKHGVNALHPALYNLQYDGFVKECKEKRTQTQRMDSQRETIYGNVLSVRRGCYHH